MHRGNPWRRASLTATALLLGVLFTLPAWGQQVKLPRAKTPLTLLGFESPDAATMWTGMKCKVTTDHVSEGKSALSILYPKWDGKGDTYLPAIIAWADGKGYAEKDWSHYGKISFDAWVDGDKPLEVTVELNGGNDSNGWTKEILVKPGEKNSFEMSVEDAASSTDVSNIQRIVVYGVRPVRDITLTIDNVRLLPGDKLPFAVFDLVYPNYREMIFPGVPSIQATVDLQIEEYGVTPADLTLNLTAMGGGITRTNSVAVTGNMTAISVPATELPTGYVALTAEVIDTKTGKALGTQKWKLRNLSKAEAKSFKVYVDENNNTIADGKPFFPIGWFGNPSLDQFAEVADGPFNTMLPYGANNKSKAYMMKYLDMVQSRGMKLIYCMNDIYPTATFLDDTGWEGVHGNDNITDAVVNAYKNHPAVLAWYLNDERPKELVPRFEGQYRRVQNSDPNHPSYIVIYHLPELKYFPTTTDIMGVDRYPVPMDPVTAVTNEMQVSKAAVKGHKPTWAVIQQFGWYQYSDAYPDRGRIPSAEDLKAGRAPSYDESRCMTYLALAGGAKGLLYYCYYDLRVLPQYAEMWDGVKKIAAEVKAISPILLSPNDLGEVSYTPSNAEIRTKLKAMDGQLYLIAVNSSSTPCKVTFDLKQARGDRVSVMFEGRYALDMTGTKLTDSFKPLEVHVYDLGRAK